jgi:hypothetical protein
VEKLIRIENGTVSASTNDLAAPCQSYQVGRRSAADCRSRRGGRRCMAWAAWASRSSHSNRSIGGSHLYTLAAATNLMVNRRRAAQWPARWFMRLRSISVTVLVPFRK